MRGWTIEYLAHATSYYHCGDCCMFALPSCGPICRAIKEDDINIYRSAYLKATIANALA